MSTVAAMKETLYDTQLFMLDLVKGLRNRLLTSFIGAMISGVRRDIIKQQRAQKRPRGEDNSVVVVTSGITFVRTSQDKKRTRSRQEGTLTASQGPASNRICSRLDDIAHRGEPVRQHPPSWCCFSPGEEFEAFIKTAEGRKIRCPPLRTPPSSASRE
jgi:hypothetical protein